ncbi:hypothetical protein CSUB01_02038 [Colletotrichum sublineola]|uniref:Uncharacterized protein n=1 Tax=Colletotrichum sublineola TaxID=1173701 RepID=A0A066X8J1_COLSU|nr:hypothetical protein CSUB01_02038 [Colletotrichum sublineola]
MIHPIHRRILGTPRSSPVFHPARHAIPIARPDKPNGPTTAPGDGTGAKRLQFVLEHLVRRHVLQLGPAAEARAVQIDRQRENGGTLRREGESWCDLTDVQRTARKRRIQDIDCVHGHGRKQGLAGMAVIIVDRGAAALPATHLDGVTELIPRSDAPRYLAVVLWTPLPVPDLEAAVWGRFVGGRGDDLVEPDQGYPVGDDGFQRMSGLRALVDRKRTFGVIRAHEEGVEAVALVVDHAAARLAAAGVPVEK